MCTTMHAVYRGTDVPGVWTLDACWLIAKETPDRVTPSKGMPEEDDGPVIRKEI